MALAEYSRKRNLRKSGEPLPLKKKSFSNPSFVVHRHLAGHLHYDFRLAVNGVLKSWAIPKGPSMNPADKRLAILVEDHPLDYQAFKGIIPEGYGAGIVEIWDKGRYEAVNESKGPAFSLADFKKGKLHFTLQGKKLKGEFVLIRTKTVETNNWLLIKVEDGYTTHLKYDAERQCSSCSAINRWLEKHKIPLKKAHYKISND